MNTEVDSGTVLLRQLGHRDTRCTSLDGETSREVGRIVGAALAVACCFICVQSDSHQKSDGNYFGVCGLLKVDGGGKTLTFQAGFKTVLALRLLGHQVAQLRDSMTAQAASHTGRRQPD